MQIIEITGIPGSGKSTFFVELSKFFDNNHVSYVIGKNIKFSPFVAIKTLSIYMFNNPKAFSLICLALIWRLRYGKVKDFVLSLSRFVRTISQYHIALADKNNKTVAIFDEGYIHRAQSLFVFDPRVKMDSFVENYFLGIPETSLVIFKKCETSIAKSRIIDRGLPVRWRSYSDNVIKQLLQQVEVIDQKAQNFIHNNQTNYLIDPEVNTKIISVLNRL